MQPIILAGYRTLRSRAGWLFALGAPLLAAAQPAAVPAGMTTAAAAVATPAVLSGGEMSAPDALAQVQAGKLTLIDIRTPAEWQQTGLAKGARRAEWAHPKGLTGFVQDVLKASGGNKATPVALICRTGNRSTQAQRYLIEQGFTQVLHVKEGMAGSAAGPGWLRRGLPLE